MPLNIIRNDITKVSADAIVNTANPEVAIGYGVDKSIYEAAGVEPLLKERAKIGPMQPGQAASTPAFALDAKYIIHTIGPVWIDGDHGEKEAVASCYRNSLRIADELKCESIAFPLISTGTYGFPKDEALRIAVSEISSFLFTHDMNVYMVVYDQESFVVSGKAFAGIKSFIGDEDVVPMAGRSTYSSSSSIRTPRKNRHASRKYDVQQADIVFDRETKEKFDDEPDIECAPTVSSIMECEAVAEPVFEEKMVSSSLFDYDTADLEGVLDGLAEPFQQLLFQHIDRKGLKDSEVYHKANLDRRLFSKIRSNQNYIPKKKTVLALAIGLELNMDETINLLRRAGYALSPSSIFDKIVSYCINHRIYNIYEINTYLFDYKQPLLGE